LSSEAKVEQPALGSDEEEEEEEQISSFPSAQMKVKSEEVKEL